MIVFNRFHINDRKLARFANKVMFRGSILLVVLIMTTHIAPQVFGWGTGWR